MTDTPTSLAEALAEIERLRARVHELELSLEIWRKVAGDFGHMAIHGTLAEPTPDEATTIVHDVPPNAPR
jgi:hypothetical protein